MALERVIPFPLMPAAPADGPASVDVRLNQLVRLVEDVSSDIRLLRQDSIQLAKAILGASPYRVTSLAGSADAVEAGPGDGLRVRLFGEMEVSWRGQSIDLPLGRKARLLLAFLAVSRPGGREKNELLGVFWPDSRDARAANNLSIAVHQVRSWLGSIASEGREMIAVRQSRYALQGACRVDVEEFRTAISRARRAPAGGDPSEARHGFQLAISVYRGEFLASEPCEEWALNLRRELAAQYIEAAKWLAREAVTMRAWGGAIEHAERIRAADDLDEEAYQLLMLAHWKSGARSRAIQAFRECEARLADALGLRPSPLTLKLYKDVRSG
jgi:DNA-binding SARP family transcriptional activator